MERSADRTGPGLPGPDNDGRVDEMVEESFPASDPPAGWAGEDPRDVPRPSEGVDPPEGDVGPDT